MVIHWVHFYQLEKKASLAPGTLNQADNNPVPRLKTPWTMVRDDASTLAEALKKFNEWSDVAEKNKVQDVHKEIAQLGTRQTLYFHREKDAVSSKSWLVVTYNFSKTQQQYKLSAVDVSALAELLGKLPALDAQVGKTEPKKPTDALFK